VNFLSPLFRLTAILTDRELRRDAMVSAALIVFSASVSSSRRYPSMPSLTVNPASKPSLMDVRAGAPSKKIKSQRSSPTGATPPLFSLFFLASGTDFSRADCHRLAMKPA
jgi:hypothetical protein